MPLARARQSKWLSTADKVEDDRQRVCRQLEQPLFAHVRMYDLHIQIDVHAYYIRAYIS
jgi:hypothetical protein